MSDKVWVILNESIVRGQDIPITEIVQPMHRTLEGAITALVEIAEDAGVEYDHNSSEHSVYLPIKGTAFESDEYYIEEVEVVE